MAQEFLSLETGFIDEIRIPKGHGIQFVDLNLSADPSEFEIPEPPSGARDKTEDFRKMFSMLTLAGCKECAYEAGIKAAQREDYEVAAFRSKMSRVFESVYTPTFKVMLAEPTGEASKSVDQFVEWYESQDLGSPEDPDRRAELEEKTFNWEFEFKQDFAKVRRAFASGIPTPKLKSADPEKLAVIASVDQEVFRAVFEQEIVSPLLDRLHKGVSGDKKP